MIIQHLIVKEFKQIFRNKIFPIVFVILPFGLVNGVPRIATMEIKDLLMTVIDKDHSTTTKQLINKIDASQYINLASLADDYDDGIAAIQSEVSDVIVEFPKDFEKNMIKTGEAEIMLSANATNGTKGAMAQNYITQIITDYFHTAGKGHIIEPRYLYNTSVDYKYYMIPAMMGLFLILIVGFLPAMNIVSEKEKGTIEQINVTPIKKWEFILSKTIPYIIIGLLMVLEGIIVSLIFFDFLPSGNILSIFLLAFLFCLVVSSLGLVISNYSNTLQQAALTMFFFLVIFIIMSGLISPIQSMPKWAQIVTYFNPLRYFIEANRAIYLKGSSIVQISFPFLALLSYSVIMWTWAMLSYKKNS